MAFLIYVCHLLSDFGDIFNVQHFIDSLRDEVKIIKSLPKKFSTKVQQGLFSMPPVSWSNEKYYLKQVGENLLSNFMDYLICRSRHD